MKRNKSILKSLLIVFLLIPCLLFFSACSSTGKSAYELAVEQGFVGTLDEWLDSLKGTDGKDGTDGENGTNGQDATAETTYQMYLKAKELGEFDGEYIEFIRDVLKIQETNEGIIANNCLPSVVTIYASSTSSEAHGSGVIYKLDASNNAFVITNYHVAYNSYAASIHDSFSLNFYGNTSDKAFPATFVGGSKTYDLAILYVENNQTLTNYGAKAITINTTDVLTGSNCFAIGNTNAQGISITSGCISVDSELRTISSGGYSCKHRVIRHDAYTTNGNSGGGLFNTNGELIGITNGGLSTSSTGGNANMIKFAIPASVVKGVADNIIANCFGAQTKSASTFIFGFDYYSASSSVQTDDIFQISETIKISAVNSTIIPNDKNLRAHDTIVSLTLTDTNGSISKTVSRLHHVEDFLLLANSSHTLKLELSRDGVQDNFYVELDLSTFEETFMI